MTADRLISRSPGVCSGSGDSIGVSPGSPGYSSSPMKSSPLSNPPIVSSHQRSLRRFSASASGPAQPTPIPSKSLRRLSFRSPPTSLTPSRHVSQNFDTSTDSPTPASPPLSRSQPLLGSFSLSLLHSRMSHAHKPHSVTPSPTTGFSLHIGAIGKGKSCPRELRCPGHEVVPVAATYYDLEDGDRKSHSPWVGTIDLEDHYYNKYITDVLPESVDQAGRQAGNIAPPPRYPGYRVAPIGQLQMLIKTPDSAVKVFLVPYDLRHIPPGGRLLAMERTFVKKSAVESPDPQSSPSPASPRLHGARERLKYSIQLQFLCVPRTEPSVPLRESSTTRRTRRQQDSLHFESGNSPNELVYDYYLARTIKVIFTTTPSQKDEVERSERTDEVVFPSQPWDASLRGRSLSSSPVMSTGSFRQTPPIRDEWEVVCQKWHARRAVEAAKFEVEPVSSPTSRSNTPVSLLSSQVLSAPSQSASLSAPLPQTLSPTSLLSPLPTLHQHAASVAEKSGVRAASPQPSSVKIPPMVRYPSRQRMRRGSGSTEERELSEKLRHMHVGNDQL